MQGFEHERFGHLLGQVPTDDSAGEQIHEQSQVGEGACPHRNVGDVGDPNLVGAIGRRRGGQEVRTVAELMPTVGGLGDEGFRLNGPQTLDFQEFCHPIDAAGLTSGVEFHGDPAHTVTASMMPEDVADQRQQLAISPGASGLGLASPGVEAGAADEQGVTESGHGEESLESELFNECVQVGYPLRLKMLNAFFRMSRSRSTRRSSSSR